MKNISENNNLDSSTFSDFFESINKSLVPIRSISQEMSKITIPSTDVMQQVKESLIPISEIASQIRFQSDSVREVMLNNTPALQKFSIISEQLSSLFPNNIVRDALANVPTIWSTSIINSLSTADFRVNVVAQEIQKNVEDNPEKVVENLLFKDTSNPSNEFETLLFDILNNQRETLSENIKVLKEIKETRNENVNTNKYEEIHNSPTSYRSKSWYVEQIESNFIGLVITSIFTVTVGVDPAKTLIFAIVLRYLLKFIK